MHGRVVQAARAAGFARLFVPQGTSSPSSPVAPVSAPTANVFPSVPPSHAAPCPTYTHYHVQKYTQQDAAQARGAGERGVAGGGRRMRIASSS